MVDIRILDDKRDRQWQKFFIRACGLCYEDYVHNEALLTREILESHLSSFINQMIAFGASFFDSPEKLSSNDSEVLILSLDDIYIGFQILGLLILETGAKLPFLVKDSVLYSTTWEYDKHRGWSEYYEEERKKNLKNFRRAILNHKSGHEHSIH